MSGLRVLLADEAQFSSMGAEWRDLLMRSTADPLFCSWEWLYCWWRHHAVDFELTLLLLVAYRADVLVGVAPFCVHEVTHKPGLRARRLELLGNLWRTAGAVMSERTGFVVDRNHAGVWASLAAAAYERRDWGDLLVSHTDVEGETVAALRHAANDSGCFVREVDPMSAYHIDLSQGFNGWLDRLGGSARRQVFNKRSRLESTGAVGWDAASSPAEADALYADLDRLHEARWGWSATGGRLGRVYREFGDALVPPDALQLRRLRIGPRTIAVSRAYRRGDTLYDVQSAMDAGYDRSISPGYLQSGFLVQEACALGLTTLDLLGGRGRQVDYKARLGGVETKLACLQVVRSPVLQALHRAYSAGRRLLTKAGLG